MNFTFRQLFSLATGILLLILGSTSSAFAQGDVCWRDSYGRGVGTIPGNCEMHQDKSGLLCYPKCKKGYTGVSFVCWQDCPSGYRNDGAFCAKPAPYGRGAGYPWKFGDKAFSLDGARKRCRKKHGSCEKSGQIIYPKCKKGYKAVGCCICSPKCPSGMGTDIGVSCTKKSYTRKTILPSCPAGMENDAGLCYKKCKPGYDGIGPVCWGTCPPDKPVNCGAACAKSSADCALAVTDQVVSVTDIVSTIALSVVTGGAGGAAKQVATKGAKTAVKVGTKAAVRQSAKQSMKKAAKKLGRTGKAKIKASLKEMRNKARRKGSKDAQKLTDDDINRIADALDNARTAAETAADPPMDNLEVLEMADPTGIMAVVQAYNKPICSAPQTHRHPTVRPTPSRPTAVRPAVRPNVTRPSPVTSSNSSGCESAVQGKIAWDKNGSKKWAPSNVKRLCKGSNGSQAAWCFARAMHDPKYLGWHKPFNWSFPIDLCEGSQNADATLDCYAAERQAGKSLAQATAACDERSKNVCASAVQGKIAWSKGGSKQWNPSNVTRLCGNVPGTQPAQCFDKLIQGRGITRRDRKPWTWGPAIDLCKGALSVETVETCYSNAMREGLDDAAAIKRCGQGRRNH